MLRQIATNTVHGENGMKKPYITEWSITPLAEVRDKEVKYSFAGGPFGSNLKVKDYTNNGVRIIQLQNIGDGYFNDEHKIYTSKQKADELISCNIYPGEIIIAKMADPLARAAIIPSNDNRYLMASDGIRLKVDENRFNKYYVLYFINHIIFRNEALKRGTGTTRKRIGLNVLGEIPVLHPGLNEQQKISSILLTWDKAIELKEKLIEQKKEQKKVLMQKLLTGEVRLPGYNGEWNNIRIKEVCAVLNGGTPSTNVKEYWGGNIPWCTPTDITSSDKDIYSTKTYITEKGLENSSARLLPKNSILMCSRATIGPRSINKVEMATNQGFKSFVCKKDHLDYEFFYYLLSIYIRYFVRIANGSTFLEISKRDVENTIIYIPSDIQEQKAVADILSTADKKIELLEKEVEQLKLQKKGLMLLLLTGKVRVKV